MGVRRVGAPLAGDTDVKEGGASVTACPYGMTDGACGTRRGFSDGGGGKGHSCGCRPGTGTEARTGSSTSSPARHRYPKEADARRKANGVTATAQSLTRAPTASPVAAVVGMAANSKSTPALIPVGKVTCTVLAAN